MVIKTLEAAQMLEKEGISVEVIDPRSLSPLDIDTVLESISRTHRLLIVDEDFSPCGAGAEIAAQVMERGFYELDAPVRRVNGVFAPAPYSPTGSRSGPERESIAQALRVRGVRQEAAILRSDLTSSGLGYGRRRAGRLAEARR
jgi:pyruvate/2-oxoglutarate/acetoin dehydrogenase E1 component